MEAPTKRSRIALVDISAKMGGVEFSTLFLAQQTESNAFEYVVLCPEPGPLVEYCRDAGVHVEVIPHYRLWPTSLEIGSIYIPNPVAWILNIVSFVLTGFRYSNAISHLNVKLVCTKGDFAHIYGAIAGKLCGLPVVIHMQDLLSKRALGLYVSFVGIFMRLMSDYVIADGEPIQSQLAYYLPSTRISVIHNGVDTDKFSPTKNGRLVREEWGVADNEILIGNVARITYWKGQDHLINAFSSFAERFPSSKLVLVGAPIFATNAFEQKLLNLVRKHDLNSRVIMAGFRYDLPEVLAAIDIFAYTAIEKDTSPLSVVSAMASGKPIIATNVDGIAELFYGSDALLVPPNDDESLATAIVRLIEEPNEREAMGWAARVNAEKHLGLRSFADKCEKIFARLLE